MTKHNTKNLLLIMFLGLDFLFVNFQTFKDEYLAYKNDDEQLDTPALVLSIKNHLEFLSEQLQTIDKLDNMTSSTTPKLVSNS